MNVKFLQQSLQQFFNFFLAQNCPLCGRSTPERLCVYCTRSLETCRLANPTTRSSEKYPIVVWGAYRGTLKRAIAAMKYDHHPEIGEPLGHYLGAAWLEYSTGSGKLSPHNYIVIPIPLHAEKKQQRGFNQAELIAKSFCQVTQMRLVPDGLIRVRATQAQHSLNKSDRAKNLTDVFQVGTSLQRYKSRQIILVDDIYTTGATINSAIQTLSKNHQQVAGVVAVATSSSETLTKN